jgi:hypothetical protein
MPRPAQNTKGDKPLLPYIVRRVEVLRGELTFRLECFPAFDYARAQHETTLKDDMNADKVLGKGDEYRKKACFKSPHHNLELRYMTGCNQDLDNLDPISTINFKIDSGSWPRHKGPGIVAEFTMQEGQTADFILREDPTTQGMVEGVPHAKSSHVGKAPVTDRDGARVITKLFDMAEYDPYLGEDLVDTLQREVSTRGPGQLSGYGLSLPLLAQWINKSRRQERSTQSGLTLPSICVS